MARPFKAVLFDVDGTLVDSNDAHAHAWQQALGEHGIDVEFDDVRRLIGMGGDKVKVNMKGVSAMPKMAMAHNFVLLKAGVDAASVAAAGSTARDTNYISPKSKAQIIAATGLAGGGETVSVEFTAPAAGKYTFICTFPAHFQGGMVGQLIVE